MAEVQAAVRHSVSPPSDDTVGVQHRQHIDDAGSGHKTCAIISRRARDVRPGFLNQVGEYEKYSRTGVGKKPERAERVIRVGRKNLSAGQETDPGQSANDQEDHQSASPPA